jgi:uncharacterized membrane protein
VPRSERSPLLLAGPPAAAGVAHFASTPQFDAIVPSRTWTYVSGAAELARAAGVALPRTRRKAAMVADRRHRPAARKAVAVGRLPLQLSLVMWARAVAGNVEDAR